MSPNLPSANAGTADNSSPVAAGPLNDGQRVVRKRNRVPLSCGPCRNRKLKCNRLTPCDNCIKRGDTSSCSYANSVSRRKTQTRASPLNTPDDMQHRIDRLEGLVLSLMTNGSEAAGPMAADRTLSMSMGSSSNPQEYTPQSQDDQFSADQDDEVESESDRVSSRLGVLHINNNKAMYIGDAHWASILNDITEVKNYFSGEHKRLYEEQIKKIEAAKQQSGMQYTGPAFLFGGRHQPVFGDLLASLPGKDAVDKMVQRYFNDYDPSTHILHPPSWHRCYERHWQDPERSDPAFLGQLFAICGLAMVSYSKGNDEPYEYRGRTMSQGAMYRALTQQCLLLCDYSKPVHAVLETMVLHLHGEYSKNGEADVGVWVLVGMIVRLAMRVGLHRDSKHYADITPFQGEMRRRIWTFIRQADLIFSFQVGLPSMIRSGDCDTELPRNIEDDDFDEGSATLPPPKPNGVLTPVSYLIAKASVSFVLGKIVECTQTVHATSYEEVGELDKELRATYHGLCPLLHVKAFEDSTQDPVTTLMKRINLSMLFNKSLCVLHRRFLNRAHDNSRYSESRRACIDASMELLRTQQLLFWESKPGKRLHRASWYFGTLTTHDFILAGTLVCLDLYFSAQAESVGRTSGDVEMWGTSRRDEMITMIEASRDIWNDQKDRMMEAFKAFHILNVMLEKINTMRAQHAARLAQGAFSYAAPGSQSSQYSPPQDDEKPEHSAAITLGMLSSGGLSTGPFPPTPTSNSTATMTDVPSTGLTPNFAMEQAQAAGQSPFNNFFSGASVEAPINLDWVQNRQFPDANAFYPAQFHNAPFHPPPFIQTSASHFPLTPTVYQSRIYRPDLTSPLGIAILNQTYDRLAYLVSNSESQSAWDQYMQSSSNEQAQEMWSAVDPVQPSLDLQDPNGNGQQQQLNSNLFANNPSFLPPGTTL